MKNTLLSLVLLMPSLALAAADEPAASAPAETVSMVYVALFGIIFIGMIVGFFVYLFMNEKKDEKK